MRKLVFVIFSALLIWSCGDGENIDVVGATVKLLPSSPLSFLAQGGDAEFQIRSNREALSAESDQLWCDAQVRNDKLYITVQGNTAWDDRQPATVTVTAGEDEDIATTTLTVDQYGRVPFDLTEIGNSNCFVIPDASRYRFYAGVQGRSKIPTTKNFDGCSAELLWSTEQQIIEVLPGVTTDGYIHLRIEGSYVPGNAVVGLVRDGQILWSWHLWISDCATMADKGGIMTVNLGAVSDSPGETGNMGLYYQWGRKDPFIGAAGTGAPNYPSVSEKIPFSEGDEPGEKYTAVSYVNNDLVAAWHTDATNTKYGHPQAAAAATTFVSRYSNLPDPLARIWSEMADPCPAGWHVPSYMEMLNAITSYKLDYQQYRGCYINENNFLPALGYRNTYSSNELNGRLQQVGLLGIYWTGSQRKDQGYGCGLSFASTMEPFTQDYMVSYGMPVRCLRDK